jgi:hypothetical protein
LSNIELFLKQVLGWKFFIVHSSTLALILIGLDFANFADSLFQLKAIENMMNVREICYIPKRKELKNVNGNCVYSENPIEMIH